MLLVSGFYNLPVKVEAERFNLDARFNLLSQKKADISLLMSWVSRRDAQDVVVPSFATVMAQAENELSKVEQFDNTPVVAENEAYSHALVPENDNNRQTEQNVAQVFAQASGSEDDWWMNDDAFAVQSSEDVGLLKNS